MATQTLEELIDDALAVYFNLAFDLPGGDTPATKVTRAEVAEHIANALMHRGRIVVADLPLEVYVVKFAGEWPLHVREEIGHAAYLMQDEQHRNPKAWRCRLVPMEELVIVPPSPATLVPKTQVANG